MKLIVLDPNSDNPTFGNADEAVIIEVSDDATIDGKGLKSALASGFIKAHPVGKRVGKRAAAETEAAPAKTETKATKAPPAKTK